MLMMETYVYGLKPSSKEPLTVIVLKDSLQSFVMRNNEHLLTFIYSCVVCAIIFSWLL